MSADRWAICPKCYVKARVAQTEAAEAARAAYGVKPIEEFDRLRAEAARPLDSETLESLREDWDIGVYADDEDDGRFSLVIAYAGKCQTCGFEVVYRYERRVFPEAAADALAALGGEDG